MQIINKIPTNKHIYDAERADTEYRAGEEYDIKVIKNSVERNVKYETHGLIKLALMINVECTILWALTLMKVKKQKKCRICN